MIPKTSTSSPSSSASSAAPQMMIMPGLTAAPQQPPLPLQPVQQQPQQPSYVPEICIMMHAFGDAPRPSVETGAVVEDITREQMRDVLTAAAAVAARRLTTSAAVVVSLEDLVFLMRRSPVKVQRLVKYLSIRDASSVLQSVVPGGGDHLGESGRRAKRCREFLELIDTNGLLVKVSRTR